MNAVTQNPVNTPVFEIPDPPEEFGQDGGKFYRAYDSLAEEIDDDMTKSLKEQLDGMLIFAGLFAGVNSAFLVLTLPLLSASPADDTNALLAQNNAILSQLVSGKNDSTSLNSTLPSASFAPSGAILGVNVLFALSLAFAIISSFLAVLGRQWLVYYRKRGGGGPDRQRWEQLKRFLGAERWGLELILDDILPSLLQTGLVMFCISFIIYLNTLDATLSKVVGVPLCTGLAFFVGSAVCPLWDRFCPFHSPLSHLLHWISSLLSRIARVLTTLTRRQTTLRRFPGGYGEQLSRRQRQDALVKRWFGWVKPIVRPFNRPFSIINATVKKWFRPFRRVRQEEDLQSLQVIAVQRTIYTSEDPATLLHATANILSITDLDQLKQLWSDELFRERFLELRSTSYTRATQLRGRDQFDFAASAARLYLAAATHVLISIHSLEHPSFGPLLSFERMDETNGPCIRVPQNGLAGTSPLLIMASFPSSFLSTFRLASSDDRVRDFYTYLNACCIVSSRQRWRQLSLLSWMVSQLPHLRLFISPSNSELKSLAKSYLGLPDTALVNLESAFTALSNPGSEDLLDRDSVLINLLRCWLQILGDKEARGDIKPEDLFKLLATCETVLISVQSSQEGRQIRRKLRICGKTTVNDLLPKLDADYASIPWGILDALSVYFEGLLGIARKGNQVPENEDLDVLRIYSPLMQQIFLYKPHFWEGVSSFTLLGSHFPEELLKRRTAVRQTFNSFVLEVDKAFCQVHNNARLTRDPESSWCHWREEGCIVAIHSLPPDDPDPEPAPPIRIHVPHHLDIFLSNRIGLDRMEIRRLGGIFEGDPDPRLGHPII